MEQKQHMKLNKVFYCEPVYLFIAKKNLTLFLYKLQLVELMFEKEQYWFAYWNHASVWLCSTKPSFFVIQLYVQISVNSYLYIRLL